VHLPYVYAELEHMTPGWTFVTEQSDFYGDACVRWCFCNYEKSPSEDIISLPPS
jgi:hypothetical protein